jgi:predicted Zn-dependent protease
MSRRSAFLATILLALSMGIPGAVLRAQDASADAGNEEVVTTVTPTEVLVSAARTAVQRRDWESAIARFEEALRLDPTDDALRAEFAGVLVQAGNVTRALEEYDRILLRNPDNRAVQDAAVDVCMSVRDFDSALARLQQYRSGREGDRDFMLRLARAYAWTQHPDQAVEAYAGLAKQWPDDRAILEEYLSALLAARRYEEFVNLSGPFLEKYPENRTIRLFRVDALLLQDRVAEALALLEEMTKDPQTAAPDLLLRTADMRLACGAKPAEVRVWLRDAMAGRSAPQVHAKLSALWAYDGAFHQAFADLEAARAEGAPFDTLKAAEADLFLIARMPRTALREYRALPPASSEGLQALKGTAEALVAVHKLDEAKSALRRAVIQYPGDMDGTFRYVRVLEMRGETAEALRVLYPVIESRPRNPVARLLRGRILAAAENAEQADADLAVVAEFLAANGVQGTVHSGLMGRAYLELVPSQVWLKAIALSPDDLSLKTGMAQALLNEGFPRESAEAWESILAADPKNDAARLGLAEAIARQGIAADLERRQRLDASVTELLATLRLERADLHRLAELLAHLERWEGLERVAGRLLEQQPDDGHATALRYGALGNLGRSDEAEALLRAFLDMRKENVPSEAALWGRVGYLGADREAPSYLLAMKNMTALAEKHPDNADILQKCGELAATHKDFAKGREYLDSVLAADANDGEALLWRARLESWDERYAESLERYARYQEVNPSDWRAGLERARVLGWAVRYDDALDQYDSVLADMEATRGADPAVARLIEEVRLERDAKRANWGRRERTAIGYYDRLLELRPEDPELIFDRGQMDTRLGFSRRAEDIYDRALLVLEPGSRTHNQAQGALEYERARRRGMVIQSYDFRRENGFSSLFEITEHLITTAVWSPEYEGMWRVGVESQEAFYDFDGFPDPIGWRGRLMARKLFDSGLLLDAWLRESWYSNPDHTTVNLGMRARYKAFDRFDTLLAFERLDVIENYPTLAADLQKDQIRAGIGMDLARRWRIEAEGAFVHFEDSNDGVRASGSVAYEIMQYPRILKLSYGADWWDFNRQGRIYFSPKEYLQHGPMLHWRHYLNREHYTGAEELYYGIKLPLRVDNDGEFYWGAGLEFLWDINRRWTVSADFNGVASDPYEGYFSSMWVRYRF